MLLIIGNQIVDQDTLIGIDWKATSLWVSVEEAAIVRCMAFFNRISIINFKSHILICEWIRGDPMNKFSIHPHFNSLKRHLSTLAPKRLHGSNTFKYMYIYEWNDVTTNKTER